MLIALAVHKNHTFPKLHSNHDGGLHVGLNIPRGPWVVLLAPTKKFRYRPKYRTLNPCRSPSGTLSPRHIYVKLITKPFWGLLEKTPEP